MTDDGRFLSRRERRAQQQREAGNAPANTDALEVEPISESIPTHAPDGRLLSRRERRRLERMRQPMETWTAEEEMIATGQIPAMTPERIAEQEKLARERAAQAQREAEAASAELQGLMGHPAVTSGQEGAESPDQPAWAPTSSASEEDSADPQPHNLWEPPAAGEQGAEDVPGSADATDTAGSFDQAPPADSSPPARTSLIAAVAADVTPSVPPDAGEPAASHDQADEQTPPEPEDQAQAPMTFEPAPQSEEKTEPEAQVQDSPAEEGAPSAPSAPAVPGMPPGMSPEMFASLFPPGSLQRRLMEDQAAAEAGEEPTSEPEDAAAEIRRLTQEAVAGLDAATSRTDADSAVTDTAAQDEAETPTFSIPTFEPANEPEQAPPSWGAQQAPSVEEPEPSTSSPSTPAPSAPSVSHDAPFEAILGDHPETAAFDQFAAGVRDFGSPQFGAVSPDATPQTQVPAQDAPGAASAPGQDEPAPVSSSPWGEHPLSKVDREAPELPEMPPVQSVPQPDLSSVGFRPQPAHSGPVPIVEPVPTGQIEVPPRERPELTAADVPRSFKWAHLAVFGAVGLLLGVIVWQVA